MTPDVSLEDCHLRSHRSPVATLTPVRQSCFVNYSVDNSYTNMPKSSTSTSSYCPEPASPLTLTCNKPLSSRAATSS
jgi:hypothetical protein